MNPLARILQPYFLENEPFEDDLSYSNGQWFVRFGVCLSSRFVGLSEKGEESLGTWFFRGDSLKFFESRRLRTWIFRSEFPKANLEKQISRSEKNLRKLQKRFFGSDSKTRRIVQRPVAGLPIVTENRLTLVTKESLLKIHWRFTEDSLKIHWRIFRIDEDCWK